MYFIQMEFNFLGWIQMMLLLRNLKPYCCLKCKRNENLLKLMPYKIKPHFSSLKHRSLKVKRVFRAYNTGSGPKQMHKEQSRRTIHCRVVSNCDQQLHKTVIPTQTIFTILVISLVSYIDRHGTFTDLICSQTLQVLIYTICTNVIK